MRARNVVQVIWTLMRTINIQRPMFRTLFSLFAALVITLCACGGDTKPKAPPEPPPAQPNTEAKGTTIEMGDAGVNVESKDLEV